MLVNRLTWWKKLPMNTIQHQKILLVFGRTRLVSFVSERTCFSAERTAVWFVGRNNKAVCICDTVVLSSEQNGMQIHCFFNQGH